MPMEIVIRQTLKVAEIATDAVVRYFTPKSPIKTLKYVEIALR